MQTELIKPLNEMKSKLRKHKWAMKWQSRAVESFHSKMKTTSIWNSTFTTKKLQQAEIEQAYTWIKKKINWLNLIMCYVNIENVCSTKIW